MGLFKKWKTHLVLAPSQLNEECIFQSQPIEITLKSFTSACSEVAGTLEITIKNIGNASIHDIYCDLQVPKGFFLFYRGMFLGASIKHWKIDLLAPGSGLRQVIDVKLKKTKWSLPVCFNMYSLSSRHGHQHYLKDYKVDLSTRP